MAQSRHVMLQWRDELGGEQNVWDKTRLHIYLLKAQHNTAPVMPNIVRHIDREWSSAPHLTLLTPTGLSRTPRRPYNYSHRSLMWMDDLAWGMLLILPLYCRGGWFFKRPSPRRCTFIEHDSEQVTPTLYCPIKSLRNRKCLASNVNYIINCSFKKNGSKSKHKTEHYEKRTLRRKNKGV